MNNNLSRSELLDKLEELREIIGTEDLLLNLALAQSTDELQENLEYIDRMFDTNIFE